MIVCWETGEFLFKGSLSASNCSTATILPLATGASIRWSCSLCRPPSIIKILVGPDCIFISVGDSSSRFGGSRSWLICWNACSLLVNFLGGLRVGGAIGARLGSELSGRRSGLDLGKSAVVHLLSLLDQLQDFCLGMGDVRLRGQTLPTCGLGEVLVGKVKIALDFAAILRTLSSLALGSTRGGCCTVRELRWSLAICWRANNLTWRYTWIFALIIKWLFFKRIAMSILWRWLFKRSHLVQCILNGIILFLRHVCWLTTCWISLYSLSICKFQIEIDSLSKLVNIDCIFRALINVCSCGNKSIIAWSCSKWASCRSSELS